MGRSCTGCRHPNSLELVIASVWECQARGQAMAAIFFSRASNPIRAHPLSPTTVRQRTSPGGVCDCIVNGDMEFAEPT